VPAAAVLCLLLAGCATFPDAAAREWRPKLEDSGELGGPPVIPDREPDQAHPPSGSHGGPQEPVGCSDPDPLVIATCLEPIGAIAVLPDGRSALVGERTTGRVLRVQRGSPPRLVATVPVDGAAGGLTGLVLSPAYAEDRLVYAYATTAVDSRVMRIAVGEPPEPILTGIPRGPGDDRGALGVDRSGALLVATGDPGGNADATSLAGKLLRIDTLGHPVPDNPDPNSPIFSSGLRSPAGICGDARRSTTWVTDRRSDGEVLQLVAPGPLADPEWSWSDRPGVAGCIAQNDVVGVAQEVRKSVFLLRTSQGRAFRGTPETQLDGRYGRVSALAAGPDLTFWLGTVNKDGGTPLSSDDRVIRVQVVGGSGSDERDA